jgi:predicted dehydrogenase
VAEFATGAHGTIATSLRLPFVATTAAHGDRMSAWSEEDGARLFTQKAGEDRRSETPIEPVDGVVANLKAFAEAIRTRTEPETNGEEALKVVAAFDAIQKSAAAGGVFVEP